ncbi:MAG: hypothetical protein LBB49_00205, partial [Gracilibacteraceae bacterium]|jgi:hypothetical protein|nr:hypothetical protein [Gracilibacteraceae bacterium]
VQSDVVQEVGLTEKAAVKAVEKLGQTNNADQSSENDYAPILCIDTDHADYGGFGPRNSFIYDAETQCLKISLVPRTALVYRVGERI